MNQKAVRDYIVGQLQSMAGLAGLMAGKPEPMPSLASEYPLACVTVGDPVSTWMTYSTNGTIASAYDVTVTVYLGTPDTPYEEAEDQKLPFADRFRALFAPDATLGGNCFECFMGSPQNNMETYRELEEYPRLAQRLTVVEHTRVGAAASV